MFAYMYVHTGAVVTWLYAEQGRDAWQTFQDCMQIESFSSCDEAFAADALLQQFRCVRRV